MFELPVFTNNNMFNAPSEFCGGAEKETATAAGRVSGEGGWGEEGGGDSS